MNIITGMKTPSYRAKRKAEGKCVNCGSLKDSQSKFRVCDPCRVVLCTAKQMRRQERKDRHECYDCSRPMPADWPHVKCPACKEKIKERHRAFRARRQAAGLCSDCNNAAEPGRRLCAAHRAKYATKVASRSKRLVKQGLCGICGKRSVTEGRSSCSECVAVINRKDRRRSQRRVSAGLCIHCGKVKAAEGVQSCDACRKKINAKKQLVRDRVFAAYGGPVCVCCGESHREFLQIDHVNNDGASHRRTEKGATALYSWLVKRNFPVGFQVLCVNCNFAKSAYGRCPHQDEKHVLPKQTGSSHSAIPGEEIGNASRPP